MEVTYAVAKKSFDTVIDDQDILQEVLIEGRVVKVLRDDMVDILNFIEQHKPPTLKEVVKAWEQCYGNKEVVEVKQEGLSISVFYDGHRDFFINSDLVYWDEFPYKTVETHHAINLTVRFLKSMEDRE